VQVLKKDNQLQSAEKYLLENEEEKGAPAGMV
jgi:hypothetical protein